MERSMCSAMQAVVINARRRPRRMDSTKLVLLLSTTASFLVPIFGFWPKEMEKKKKDKNSSSNKSWKAKVAVGS